MSQEHQSLIDACYAQVYDLSHNQDNIDAANVTGGILGAALAAIESNFSSLTAIVGAAQQGYEHGAAVLVPWEALVSFVDCAGPAATLQEVSGNHAFDSASE